MAAPSVRLVELRVLDGPNLYFTRPAIKLTLDVTPLLEASEDRVERLAERARLKGVDHEQRRPRPGQPGTEQRRRFVARVAAHVTRQLADAARTHLAVRSRPGAERAHVVVAYPWRRRGSAEALGGEVAEVMGALVDTRKGFAGLLETSSERLAAVDPGPAPTVPDPTIPVIAVTGTNGKTTTVRVLAHIARTAGRSVAYSSTDGVYVDGRLVQPGDYSGFGGAARALAEPGIDLAVLETARGGLLLRGIGTLHNDVAVVTNVSADHLGLHGIRTLDQLAEVKAAVTHITRPQGWDVLNADDPRVLAMRRGIRGRPWLFSLDSDHPAIRSVLAEGGRGTTVLDGQLTFLTPGRSRALLPLEDIPMTLSGISTPHTMNALGVASAARAVGLPEDAIREGLRTFVFDEQTNPGRANIFLVDGRVVVADYAHNEAGLAGLVEVCRGLRRPGAEIWLAFGTAGDRTDEALHGLGYIAARGADHVRVAELADYLRGRQRDDVSSRLRAGAIDGGASDVPIDPDEIHALHRMLEGSRPDDVVAITALAQRPEVFADLAERGAVPAGPDDVRALVRRARVA
jgi:cyanophycin synthetase